MLSVFRPPFNVYEYGFQGQEKDDEVKDEGNSVNYKYRMHDPRIGRFFAVDPLASKYPHYTPYQFSGNKVIDHIELEGLEEEKIKLPDGTTTYLYVSDPSSNIPPPIFQPVPITDEEVKAYQANKLQNSLDAMRKYHASFEFNTNHTSATRNAQMLQYNGHFGLDVVGMVPVFGEVADGVNAAWYALEGNYTDAAISSMAMIPVVGWGATSTKWVGNTLKIVDNSFLSASGLVFKKGSKHGNRLSHVLKHQADDLTKDFHGVFDSKEELISVIDDAWAIAQKGGDNVVKTTSNGRDVFLVNMKKRIGYEGGSKGSGDALEKIKIVVDEGTSDVITIYPSK